MQSVTFHQVKCYLLHNEALPFIMTFHIVHKKKIQPMIAQKGRLVAPLLCKQIIIFPFYFNKP